MSNITDRHQARKKMIERLDSTRNGESCFEIIIAITQAEILDEYLEETLRSNKVIEGLLRDICRDIERGAETIAGKISS